MSKNKIAESIIIRVGGGIREVPRESAEGAEGFESTNLEPGFESTEDVHPFGVEAGTNSKGGSGKIIN